ncbi:type 2 lanthipeptide synthetase LanM [Halomonas getboli]|uniref:type 2 lanthipeptide synthetase LanM n=1 Tax=Halomonas getboli TaxID=2935862 RepID=UPI001FFF1058|nr:type 2 lanthipeptide synthetase LanM [Halomonas getboli]MCK2184673.1 type 2 lanthipeptide synthetase LanM [Halomonas getboli]
MNFSEGTLLAGMELSKLSSTWGIYKGDVERGDGEIVSVYIKPSLPPRFAFREFFAAFLAKKINVSTPDPYLVFIPEVNNLYASEKAFSSRYCFAMEIKQYPDMSRNFSGGFFSCHEVAEEFLKKSDVALMGIFDEIIFNQDRHHENILYDGENICLIDHENILCDQDVDVPLSDDNWMWGLAKNASEISFRRVERKVFQLLSSGDYENIPDCAYRVFWEDLVAIYEKLGVGGKRKLKLDALTYCYRSRNILSLSRRTCDSHKTNQIGLAV